MEQGPNSPQPPERQRLTYEQALVEKQKLVDGILTDYQNLCGLGVGVSGQDDYRKVAIRTKKLDSIGTAVFFADKYIPGVPVDIEYTGELTAATAAEVYARTEMARGRLLTWTHDIEHNSIVFVVLDGVDMSTIPDEIEGIPVEKISRPRAVPQAAERLARAVEQADAGRLHRRPEESRGVQIDPKPDDRIERIIANPEKYFAEARERVRKEVEAEIEDERRRGLR